MVWTLNQEMNNAWATIRPNNSSPVELFPSTVEGAVFCSVLATEAALIVASNLLTLFLFAVTKKLRKRSLFLVWSMACADLMIGTLSLPGYIYLYVGDQFMLWEPKVNLSLDIFFVAVEVIFSPASLISAASISFERLYAVYWPLKHRTLSVRLYRLAIFIVWTLAALISALVNLSYFIISHKVSIHFWISYASTLLLILCGCNIAIWRKVQGRSNPASHLQNRAIQNQRLTNTLLFVSIFPLLTWLPLIIVNYFYSLEIGHFRVPKNLTFKARLSAKPLIWKWFLIMMQIKLIFTTKVSHLTSFWKWDFLELGNGLLFPCHSLCITFLLLSILLTILSIQWCTCYEFLSFAKRLAGAVVEDSQWG